MALSSVAKMRDRGRTHFLTRELGAPGRALSASGSLYVYEFPTNARLKEFRGAVSPDGSMLPLPGGKGSIIVEWSSPRLYGGGRVLAVYFGDDDATLAALRAIIGPPFALSQ